MRHDSTSLPTLCPDFSLHSDERSNENYGLQALHNLFVREHNRRCDWLYAHNPSWSDSELYHTARRFVIALIQVRCLHAHSSIASPWPSE